MKIALRISIALLVPVASSAFSIQSQHSQPTYGLLKRTKSLSPRFMAAEDDSGSQPPLIKSVRKEIAYDEVSGRFFETGLDETECIPQEEFCITDKGTGKLIRLTTEEKERIFLDALQVSHV
jgi:hypothetical protein